MGSGKTVSEVREIFLNRSKRMIYSNIKTKLKNQIDINPDMIIKKKLIKTKQSGEEIFKFSLNQEYWQAIKDPISVVLDEAHSVMNPRRSMSKVNIIISDWMALIRRVLGSTDAGYGELVLITQLDRRLDIIAREMATQIRYHVCHYKKICNKCGCIWKEHSEMPEGLWRCPTCDVYNIKKFDHKIEVWHFGNMESYQAWKTMGMKTFYKHYIIYDIEKYFKFYNTLQWDNMFSELYN